MQTSFSGGLTLVARILDLRNNCLIIVLDILLSAFLFAQSENIKFEHLTVQDGLSDNRVFSIIQDNKGFIWFGTYDGLNRYDGYRFKIYRNNPNDSLGLSANRIQALFEDNLNELWIGTSGGGLCRYDRDNDRFIRYNSDKDNPKSLCSDYINSIFQTDNNDLWIATNYGLNRFNRESNDFKRYLPDDKNLPFDDNENYIGDITQDENGQIWIGSWNQGLFKYNPGNDNFEKYKPKQKYARTFTNKFSENLITSHWKGNSYLWFPSFRNGLFKINLSNDEIVHYQHQPYNPFSIRNNLIYSIYQAEDENELLWIGTEFGLDQFNIRTERFAHYQHQPENSFSRNYDPVWAIFKDKSGLMWVGTAHGVCKFVPNTAKFKTIQIETGNPEGLSGGFVWAIQESKVREDRSVIWIGTDDGLFSFNRTSGQFTKYKHKPENINSLSNNSITEIIQSELGDRTVLWVCTMNGLNKIDLKTEEITRYYIPNNDPVYNQMYTMCEDKRGIIWIGTQTSFLFSFDPEQEQFTQYPFKFGIIRRLYADSSSVLWIGTTNGLHKFNTVTKKEKGYYHIAGDLKSISNNSIRSIIKDKNGILWLGTGRGLNKFDHATETFICFDEKDGLISNRVRAVLEDRNGNLWLGTDKGISIFDPNSKEFRSFTTSDGIHDNEFWGATHKNNQGELFLGGRNGITYFHPDSIKENNYLPPVVLTDFQIFNKSIKPDQDSPLKKQVSEVSEITLSHEQSIFSLEFAALEYRKPDKIRYAYKMEGVDPDWVYTDATRRFVTYTHLNAGKYVFQLKASNSDGIWNEQGISVKISILPPWWKTWWAYFGYAIIIIATIYVLRRYELSRQRFKHQMELEHVEAEKLQELDSMKSRFFANISHEFRTPLTLIKGPIERWLPEIEKKEMKRDFEMTQRNTNRLLRLVNQLLDISRLESGKMKLQARSENVVELTRQLTMAFESFASVNDIELRFVAPNEHISVYLDREHYEKIIINLISNALKFTSTGGEVKVELSFRGDLAEARSTRQSRFDKGDEIASSDIHRIRKDENNTGFVEIKVVDTGSGIPSDKLPHIFDRFYQGDDSYTKDTQGSGIGLALTKELVELHHGEIEVSSEVSKGTQFTIRIPLGKDHLNLEEILPPLEETVITHVSPEDMIKEETDVSTFHKTTSSKEDSIVLIVEDNPDMRTYIRDTLVDFYKVVEAAEGQEGFEKAAEIIPDIIISDVMMPEMDGFQFCKKIKADLPTSHIPVILLTAKSSGESKVEGLETGADDYLTKPFDARELQVRVKNLIEQRERLRERFQEQIIIQPSDVTATSMDGRFLKRAIEFVEAHLDDTALDVRQFSKEMALSRSQLNRKLKALTKQSGTEFIRCLRLKRAAQLLKRRTGNISEIAYEVGFTNPSHFAEHFRKLFGVSPSKYISQQ